MKKAVGNATLVGFPNAKMVICYTGNGKGKTTAALGLALRAVGWGKKVLVIQFLKKGDYGEVRAIKKCQIYIEQYGTKDFVDPRKLRPIDFEEARKGWKRGKREIENGEWNVVILDEINVAVKFGLIKVEEVLALVKIARAKGVDLVLTGRWACPQLLELADLVTEFKEIKHPYKMGEKAKQGIDY